MPSYLQGGKAVPLITASTAAALRAVDTTFLVAGCEARVSGVLGNTHYRWNPTSTAADDGDAVLRPDVTVPADDPGRWEGHLFNQRSGIGTAALAGLMLVNSTLATLGSPAQNSPGAQYRGAYWDGAASQTVDWMVQAQTAGTAAHELHFLERQGAAAFASKMRLSSAGLLTLTSVSASGNVTAGSATITGNETVGGTLGVTGAITGASLAVTGNASAATGTFSGAVNVGSLVSAGGVSGTTGTFTGAITGASIAVTGNASAATGTFSGAATAASFAATGAVSGATGSFTGNVAAGSLTAPSLDYAGALAIGGTNATSVAIGRSGQTTTIVGNLQVNGTTTTVNSAVFDVTDRVIHTNHSADPGSGYPTSVPANMAGVAVHRGWTSAGVARDHADVVWDESTQLWRFCWNTAGDDVTVGTALNVWAGAGTFTSISTTGAVGGGAGTFSSLRDTGLGVGVVHSDVNGNFTSSLIVDADVFGSAGIQGSKLQAASAGNTGTLSIAFFNLLTAATNTATASTLALRDGSAGIAFAAIVGTSLAAPASTALPITANAASTWATTAGALTLNGFAGINLQNNASTKFAVTSVGADLTGTLTATVGLNPNADAGAGSTPAIGTSTLRWATVNAVSIIARADAINSALATMTATGIITSNGAFSIAPFTSLTLTSAGSAVWSTTSGTLTISGFTGINLQNAGSTKLTITSVGADVTGTATATVAVNPATLNTGTVGTSGVRWLSVNATTLVARSDATDTLKATLSASSLVWSAGVSTPLIQQADLAGGGATGQNLTVQAQNTTGVTSTGGALILTSGTGLSVAGGTYLRTGGVDRFFAAGTGAITISSALASAWNSTAGAITINGFAGVNLQTNSTTVLAITAATATFTGTITATVAINPSPDNVPTLGTAALRWASVNGTSIVARGTVSSEADKATLTSTALTPTAAFTLSSGVATALTLTSNAAATWSTTAGAMTLSGFAGIALQNNGTGVATVTAANFGPASDGANVGLGSSGARWTTIDGTTINARGDTSNTLKATLTSASLTWSITVVTPTITQTDNTTGSATASALLLSAQNATGATSTGGMLRLRSGSGTTAGGVVRFEQGASTLWDSYITGSLVRIAPPTTGVNGLQLDILGTSQRIQLNANAANSYVAVSSARFILQDTSATTAGTWNLLSSGASDYTWAEGVTATLTQATRTSDAVTHNTTISSQAPFATATGANRVPGSLVYTVPAATNGGTTQGQHTFNVAGTLMYKVTSVGTTTTGVASYQNIAASHFLDIDAVPEIQTGGRGSAYGIRFDQATLGGIGFPRRTGDNQTVDLFIYGQQASTTGTVANRYSGNIRLVINTDYQDNVNFLGTIQNYVADVLALELYYTKLNVGVTTLQWTELLTPVLTQADSTVGTGHLMTIQAQKGLAGTASVAGSDGGALILAAGNGGANGGAGGGAGGNVTIKTGLTVGAVSPQRSITLQAETTASVVADALMVALGVPALQWTDGNLAPTLSQAARTTNGAPQNLTISAQAPFATATGTNRTPGSLIYTVGSPTNGSTTQGNHTWKIATETISTMAYRTAQAGYQTGGGEQGTPTGATGTTFDFGARHAVISANGFLQFASTTDDFIFSVRNSGNTTTNKPKVYYQGGGFNIARSDQVQYNGTCDIQWFDTVTAVNIFQMATTGATGALLTVQAQASSNASGTGGGLSLLGGDGTGTNAAGGVAIVRGGAATGTGLRGAARLSLGAVATIGVEVCEVIQNKRIVSMNRYAALTTTQMPANTGDAVMYLANAATDPTANAVGGGILFVSGGALKWRGSSGTVTTLGAA